MRLRVLVFVLASLFFASTASADEKRWYGWQTLAIDAAAATVLIGASTAGSSVLGTKGVGGTLAVMAGVGAYGLGGAAVHLAHGSLARAAGSLGLRLVVPVLTGLAGIQIERADCAGREWCGVGGGALGLLGGIAAAVAIDATVLAWEPVRKTPSVSVGLAPTRGGITAGFTAAF